MQTTTLSQPTPSKVRPVNIFTGQVGAVTKVRRGGYLGGQNIGVLITDIDTKEKEWHNSYRNLDLKYADYVRVEEYQSHSIITVITREEATSF